MPKSLVIRKETLSVLTGDELAGVVGAAAAYAYTEPCVENLRRFVNEDILDIQDAGASTVICI